MVHHITLFKLKPEVTPAKLEQIMMTTRMTLLKIPEILSVRCGKNETVTTPKWPNCSPNEIPWRNSTTPRSRIPRNGLRLPRTWLPTVPHFKGR